jgi:LPXTG-motif cell wall-anchored protein
MLRRQAIAKDIAAANVEAASRPFRVTPRARLSARQDSAVDWRASCPWEAAGRGSPANPRGREEMDTNTLLIIVILFLLLGGGGFFYSRRGI